MSTRSNRLIGGGIFDVLDRGALARISAQCHWQSHARGAVILGEQLPAEQQVMFVRAGRVKVTVQSESGREVILRTAGPGEIVGDYAAIDDCLPTGSVEALEDTVVACFSAEEFRALLLQYPQLLAAELHSFAADIRRLTDQVAELSTLAVGKRLLVYLLRFSDAAAAAAAPGMVPLADLPTHAEIAASISSHREAVTKELSRLEQDGVLARQGRVLLLNLPRLRARLVR